MWDRWLATIHKMGPGQADSAPGFQTLASKAGNTPHTHAHERYEVKFMIEEENLREAARLLNKYKEVHIVDLMDDVDEKLQVIILKVADMDEDELEENAVFHTLDKFLSDIVTKLSYAKKGIDDIKSEVDETPL